MNFHTLKMATIPIVIGTVLFSCSTSKNVSDQQSKATVTVTTSEIDSYNQVPGTNAVNENINVEPLQDSKAFPGADLKVASIQTSDFGNKDSVKLNVNYAVQNFTLTEHTEDHHAMSMANSAQGQHIHFILDNTPYAALYKPENSVKVAKNSEHYLLSFLSRSYHESIKEPNAFVLEHFKIDANGKYEKLTIPKTPMLFYSRPKGAYKGPQETKNILLDFYLINAKLGVKDYKVQADINGELFVLDSWQPYQITGLPYGKSTITLTLLDQFGSPLSGPNTSITREITLSEK